MGDITTADFERVPDTIPLGEAAARAKAAELAVFAVPEAQYIAWRERVTQSQQFEARLADVRFEGLKRVNPEFLASREGLKSGDLADATKISTEAQRMAALQEFDSVGYRLDGDPANPTLTWLPREKSWGPNYLKADLGLYTSADGDLTFTLYGRHTRTWVNPLGAEWRNELQFGGDSLLATSFYQPLDVSHRFFIEPRVAYSIEFENIFLNDERVARYKFEDAIAQVDFGVNAGRYAQARLGYVYDRRQVNVDIGSPLLAESDPEDAGVVLSAQYDSRDTAFAPTRGMTAALEYINSDDALGSDRNWQRAELGSGHRGSVPPQHLVDHGGGRIRPGRRSAGRSAFTLGGPNSFPGFELNEMRVGGYWNIGTSYLWNVKDVLPLRNLALYAGVRVVGGAVYDRFDQEDAVGMYGGSFFLTGRTMVGPLTLGIGGTSTDSWSVWLSVGRPVGHGTILERGIFR